MKAHHYFVGGLANSSLCTYLQQCPAPISPLFSGIFVRPLASVRRNHYLPVVRSLHMSHGPNPLQPGLRLKQTLGGIERKYFSSPKQETLLTSDILSDRYSDLYHPHVWRRHGTMGGHHRLCSAWANLQFLLATSSIRLFTSPALTHVYIPLLLAQSISPFDFKNLKRISDNKVSPFMLLIRDTLRCLRYEKEPRSSPSPWYRRQGYYALVSTFRPTPRQQNIPRLFHLLRLFILTHVHTSLIWKVQK